LKLTHYKTSRVVVQIGLYRSSFHGAIFASNPGLPLCLPSRTREQFHYRVFFRRRDFGATAPDGGRTTVIRLAVTEIFVRSL
jgi:hypothetical protein